MDVVRVLIVGADPLARAGLAAVLDRHPAVIVAGQEAPSDRAEAALGAESAADHDVILWDCGGNAGALEPVEQATAAGVPLVALVARRRDAAAALAAGARGVLARDADAAALAAALRAVAGGLTVLDPTISPAAQPAREADDEWLLQEDLTPREREVLQLLAQGLPNREIARRLGMSEHTAKFHLAAIFGKLGAHSRTEAVARAARLGLVVL